MKVASIRDDTTEKFADFMPLETLLSAHPQLTQTELKEFDNQLIVFEADVAIFQVSGPKQEENFTWWEPEFFYYDIHLIPETGRALETTLSCGKTDWCSPGDKDDAIVNAGEGRFEFVLLATNNAPGSEPQKIALQVSRADSASKWLAHRICIASISEQAWHKARPERQLVILG